MKKLVDDKIYKTQYHTLILSYTKNYTKLKFNRKETLTEITESVDTLNESLARLRE